MLFYSIKILPSIVQYLSLVLATTLYIFLNNQHHTMIPKNVTATSMPHEAFCRTISTTFDCTWQRGEGTGEPL